ncbi:hypothetical protein NEPAR06_1845 [Nematocida parisii]|uniref:uncharacterized protein n=1 Tax=Nematocida parisii (strain ERTm1 / ATCC PRA-289) TaxID=881290 RepID=UPI000264B299|nr:uncharacterized protein NEPG_01440 [Nematocida parisii ERTm1]EIJ93868.1 hypothetical protein NEPG_01440 [Nematocida parisii ERTm1]KAI5155458.1 hypothetical protein NEPAR06_1845 [Nematocida parisii]|eukprot:XP_013059268.1 hypothetical protein NEPG_01440 [Nematocida parisii ERTm1]
METGKKELSLVSKYIKDRIKEIEINMQVRNIKEPQHVNNTSFERKMRRKMNKSRARKRVKLSTAATEVNIRELSSEEVFDSLSETDEISNEQELEEEVVRKDCPAKRHNKEEESVRNDCPAKRHNKEELSVHKPLQALTKKRMKCGCVSHGSARNTTFVPNTSTTASRRKSLN